MRLFLAISPAEYYHKNFSATETNYIAPIGVRVALGRKYKLKSGLMEITYDSGAKVILEGPCDYTAESTTGGYLALGKLVARVGAGGEGRGAGEVASGQWTVDSMKDEGGRMKAESGRPNAASLATRHQPLATNPSPLSPLPSPLFTVRTPTAVVTDLGTEFGVEVDENGDTTSHVFHGSIQVRLAEVLVVSEADGDDNSTRDVILHENESVRVGSVPEMPSATTVMESVHFTLPTTPPQFVRRLREPPSLLDLLDVVSGGDGLSNRRGRGLDPTSGRRESLFIPRFRDGKRQYQPVGWHPFIDGVFVPGVDRAAVQLDSAGNTFNGFTFTSGKVFGTVWAREAEIDPELRKINDDCWMYAIGPSERFAPEGRGLLGLAPNAGITFNLEMIRRVHQDVVPNGFRAAAGIANARPYFPNAHQMADVWVFVDGRLMLKPTRLRAENTPVPVNVPIGPNDRFLTIVSTDACDGHDFDWVVFGDPALLMTPVFQNPEGMEDSTP